MMNNKEVSLKSNPTSKLTSNNTSKKQVNKNLGMLEEMGKDLS
ncbi:23092_t:CDS:2 [Gigaspora rosea]|nr:23092_t:CDS:2 [Gigaspora rosea]